MRNKEHNGYLVVFFLQPKCYNSDKIMPINLKIILLLFLFQFSKVRKIQKIYKHKQ